MHSEILAKMKGLLESERANLNMQGESSLLPKIKSVLTDYKFDEMSDIARLFLVEACVFEGDNSAYIRDIREHLYNRVLKIPSFEDGINKNFVTFDAPEGAGKTTQVNILSESLKESGFEVVCTKEPGGSDLGIKLREVLLDKDNGFINPLVEILLMESARAEHVDKLIYPELKEGKWVICDRYIDSTMAYQGYASDVSKELIENLNDVATRGLQPKKTILLDVTLEQGMGRAEKRGELDRIELAGSDYHSKVREGYLAIAKSEPSRVKVINGARSIEEVSLDIKREFSPPIAKQLFLEKRSSKSRNLEIR